MVKSKSLKCHEEFGRSLRNTIIMEKVISFKAMYDITRSGGLKFVNCISTSMDPVRMNSVSID